MLLTAVDGQAASLKETIRPLILLPLAYGTNSVTVGPYHLLITRGAFVSETAWGGDIYSVMVRDGKRWQLARSSDGIGNEINFATVPHTDEDTVTALHFFTSAPRTTHPPQLYLLRITRDYEGASPVDRTPAKFTLYRLQKDADGFGIFYLKKIAEEPAQHTYCNANAAAHEELDLPLPNGLAGTTTCAGD